MERAWPSLMLGENVFDRRMSESGTEAIVANC